MRHAGNGAGTVWGAAGARPAQSQEAPGLLHVRRFEQHGCDMLAVPKSRQILTAHLATCVCSSCDPNSMSNQYDLAEAMEGGSGADATLCGGEDPKPRSGGG
ncbi:hypothetical protein HaLaN_02166 [Haematococcus lacustris]|uniref:Uncharacterized protein n=1 Tax=Haematococcus lacustris TaxID=44745 RepID=A0A699YB26_HAELA|nr:hypothetical protein HaLaN_02166 [Haematococcus lacustris]